MFSFLKKENPAVQLYGKLPLARDYLRIGCGDGSARAWREWLDQAFSGSAVPGEAPLLPFPMRFIAGEAWGTPLMGCAWPSSDEGGLRLFPVSIFVERKRKAALAALEDGLAEADGWWRKLSAVHAAFDNYDDGARLLAGLRGQEIDGATVVAAGVDRVSLEPWAQALWPDRGVDGLDATIRELNALERKRGRGPVRLPIAAGFPIRPQVHAWWKLLCDMDFIGSDVVPTIFLPHVDAAGDEPLYTVFFFARPSPADVRWVTSARSIGERASGDCCGAEARVSGSSEPAPENVPSLADSLHGAWVSRRGGA